MLPMRPLRRAVCRMTGVIVEGYSTGGQGVRGVAVQEACGPGHIFAAACLGDGYLCAARDDLQGSSAA